MSIHEEALKIYNSLPSGSKELAASKYGTARWYFNQIISNIKTDEAAILKAIEAMSEASKEAAEDIVSKNKNVQKLVKNLKKELV